MILNTHEFELFADYFQFYLQDEQVDGNLGDSWDQDAMDRLMALAPGTIGVGTVRNINVPVIVEVHDSQPNDNLDEWDHVTECSIDIKSGTIVVAGCTDYFPDAARISVDPVCYRARIYNGKLDSLSEDGMDGDDHYRIALWQSSTADPVVLKRRVATRSD